MSNSSARGVIAVSCGCICTSHAGIDKLQKLCDTLDMTNLNVAQTILQQLGGNRFAAMTGAKNFMGDANALSFRLPGSGGFVKKGINSVKITLNAGDTYDLEFARIRGRKITTVATETNIYADSLREVFRLHTGLDTSLGIPAAAVRAFNNRHED